MSANGFVERGRWGLDWHQADDAEFGAFAVEQLDAVGTLLFGRATCEGTASFWPTPEAIAADPEVAGRMNALPEVVFSSTLARADWENTRPVRGDAAEEVAALRRQPGEDAIVLGSSDLAASLAARGLIDEVEIQLVPLVLGGGTRLFDNLGRSDLRLEPVRAIEGPGVTHLTYRVIARPRPAA